MLYLVSTPIGNLKDITLRALEILKSADVILSEDTRRTGTLLKHYEIEPPRILSFHEHSGPGRVREILSLLKEGKTAALVSDSGTPLISDPGFPLVREAIREGIKVESIPGPTALAAALAASGLPTERFTFTGFLSPKSARRRRELEELAGLEHSLIFFESPHRVAALLQDMAEILGDREAAVCRELTKKFEEIIRGTLAGLAQKLSKHKILGEIVIVVSGKGRKRVWEQN